MSLMAAGGTFNSGTWSPSPGRADMDPEAAAWPGLQFVIWPKLVQGQASAAARWAPSPATNAS